MTTMTTIFQQQVDQHISCCPDATSVTDALQKLAATVKTFKGAIPSRKILYDKPDFRMRRKGCFWNSYWLASRQGFTYFEGYFRPNGKGLFFNHAWVVTPGGGVMDITVEINNRYFGDKNNLATGEYFGIPFSYDLLFPYMIRSGSLSKSYLMLHLLNDTSVDVPSLL